MYVLPTMGHQCVFGGASSYIIPVSQYETHVGQRKLTGWRRESSGTLHVTVSEQHYKARSQSINVTSS